MITADSLLAQSPAQAWWRTRSRDRLAVLAYHGVDDPQQFEVQMQWLAAELTPIALEDLLVATETDEPLPTNAVLITFDDGERSLLEDGVPVLKKLGIPAVAFVVGGLLDTDQPFWWDEVGALIGLGGKCEILEAGASAENVVRLLKQVPNEQRLNAIEQLRYSASDAAPQRAQLLSEELPLLEEAGIAIGNHTLTHPCLDQCMGETIRAEMESSQQILTEILGRPPVAIAYPNGNHNEAVLNAAAKNGFQLGFAFDHRLNRLPLGNPLRISRLRVNSDTPMDRFKIILSGLHPMLHRLRGLS